MFNRAQLFAILAACCVAAPCVAGAVPASAPAREGQRLVNDRCPVMTDEPASPRHEIQFHGVPVRFCCEECNEKFISEPAKYMSRLPQLSPESAQALAAAAGRDERTARATSAVDRWTVPVLLGLAALLAAWLTGRLLRRRRRLRRASPG